MTLAPGGFAAMLKVSPAPVRAEPADQEPAWWGFALAATLAALTAYRFLTLASADIQLYFDEAYYWTWSTEPALGYYSKPPMIAWLMGGLGAVCGEGELCLRSGALLLFPLTAWLLFLIGRRWFGPAIGFFAGLAYATLPVVAFYSWLMTTDALLSFFWALALFALGHAVDQDRWRDWLLLGGAVGLGLLSKYTMSLFLVSVAVYLVLVPERRARFRGRKAMAGLGLAALLFLPNLVWNLGHGFASFRHTAEVARWRGGLFHPDHLLLFLGGQCLLFGPLLTLAPLLLRIRSGAALESSKRYHFLVSFTIPLLALYAGQALISRANLNWAMAAFVPAALWVAAYLLHTERPRVLIAAIALNFVLGSLMYHYGALARRVGAPLAPEADPYGWMQGWRELAAPVRTVLDQHPDAGLASDHRRVLAELLYYLRPHPRDAVIFNPGGAISDHFRLRADLRFSPRGSFVFVSAGTPADDLRPYFREVVDLGPLDLPRHPEQRARYRIFLVKQFLGYGPRP